MSDMQFNFSAEPSASSSGTAGASSSVLPPPPKKRERSSAIGVRSFNSFEPVRLKRTKMEGDDKKATNKAGKKHGLAPSSAAARATRVNKLPELRQKTKATVFSSGHDESKVNKALFSSSTFESLKLDYRLIGMLSSKLKANKPTLIQYLALPLLIGGQDALLKSKTGTGKTLAYVLPILHQLINEPTKVSREQGTKALIVAPTRELSLQIYNVLNILAKACVWIVPGIVMGGEKKKAEKARLRKGVTVLVATPGRLLDHLQTTKAFKTRNLRWLVFDEADRLLDLGFDNDIKEILSILEERHLGGSLRRQNVLVSATLNPKIESLAKMALEEPVEIGFEGDGGVEEEAETPSNLRQYYMEVSSSYRLAGLGAFLRTKIREAEAAGGHCKGMVFVSTIAEVEFLYKLFSHSSWPFNQMESLVGSDGKSSASKGSKGGKKKKNKGGDDDSDGDDDTRPALVDTVLYKLHGDMKQKARTEVYNEFKASGEGILFCTDVAARGLDLPSVNFILQYDPPEETQEYIHRAGRTGRLGQQGSSYIFLLPSELGYLDVLAKHGSHLTAIDLKETLDSLSDISNLSSSAARRGTPKPRRLRTQSPPGMLLQKQFEFLLRLDAELSDLARKAYLSFIRSYSTYAKDLKGIFHPKKLHLGHVAKSFALKEGPKELGSIGKKRDTNDDERSNKKNKKNGGNGNGGADPNQQMQIRKAFKKVDTMSEFM